MGRFASKPGTPHFALGAVVLAGVLACAAPAGAENYYPPGSYVFAGGSFFRQRSAGNLSGPLVGWGWRFNTFYTAEIHYAYMSNSRQLHASGISFRGNARSHWVESDFLGYLPIGRNSPFSLVGDVNIGFALTRASGLFRSSTDSSFVGGVGGGLQYQFGADWGLRALARYEGSTGSGNGSAPGVELTLIAHL